MADSWTSIGGQDVDFLHPQGLNSWCAFQGIMKAIVERAKAISLLTSSFPIGYTGRTASGSVVSMPSGHVIQVGDKVYLRRTSYSIVIGYDFEVTDRSDTSITLNSSPGVTSDISVYLQKPLQIYEEVIFTDWIQSQTTTLIPKYANHTDNSGNWDGQSSIPKWTEATILSAISAASRLTCSRLSAQPDWIIQQYKIMNMLRWIHGDTGTSWPYTEMQTKTGWAGGTTATFNDAVTAFNAASWSSASGSGTTVTEDCNRLIYFKDADDYKDFTIRRRKGKIVVTNNTGLSADIDTYMYHGKPSYGDAANASYEDNDASISEGTYDLQESYTLASGGVKNVAFGVYDGVSITDPGTFDAGTTWVKGWAVGKDGAASLTEHVINIIKPSFAFKDW